METTYIHCGLNHNKIDQSTETLAEQTYSGPSETSSCCYSSSQYSNSTTSELENACVAYAEQEPLNDREEYTSERQSRYSSEYECTTPSYDGSVKKGFVSYAEQEPLELENIYNECGEYENTSSGGTIFDEDNIYAYIAEYEEIEEYDDISSIEQFYVTIEDKKGDHQALQRVSMSGSCFAAILNPHQLLFGWRSKVPWACQTTLRTWSRVLSTRMGVQFSVTTSGPTSTVTFLRRTVKDYCKRAPKGIQPNETIPNEFISNILTVFKMAKHKPTRYKHIIGISCFPIHMSLRKSLWKDLSLLAGITNSQKKEKTIKKNAILASTDAAGDRVGQLQNVVASFYSKKYQLEEKLLRTYVLDTGVGYRNMHSSVFAMKALTALAQRGQSILLPEPCHPTLSVWFNVFQYTTGVTPRYYRRDPKRSWMLDLGDFESKIDETTAAMFISNPSVMCGGICSLRELDILVKILSKKNIPLIIEETFDYMVYDRQNPSHSVLELKPAIPLIVINSCYRWMIFGAQGPTLAWALTYDPESRLPPSLFAALQGVQDQSLKMSSGLPSPSILASVLHYDGWANDIVKYMAENMVIACRTLNQTPGLFVAPPKAGYFLVILIDIENGFDGKFDNDTDFSSALFSEESVKVICGSLLLGWKNSFALEMYMRRDLVIEACDRIDEFCRRHSSRKE